MTGFTYGNNLVLLGYQVELRESVTLPRHPSN